MNELLAKAIAEVGADAVRAATNLALELTSKVIESVIDADIKANANMTAQQMLACVAKGLREIAEGAPKE